MIAIFLEIVSLSVFAFKIKILNRNPWAGVLYCNRSDHSCWHSCDISCKKRFSVLLLLLPPNHLSRKGCHSKTSRQIARNIALCVTPDNNLAPWDLSLDIWAGQLVTKQCANFCPNFARRVERKIVGCYDAFRHCAWINLREKTPSQGSSFRRPEKVPDDVETSFLWFSSLLSGNQLDLLLTSWRPC